MMSLGVHPDPQEPAGGFAFLELPGGSLGEGPVPVAVFEVYSERWLGPAGETDDRVSIGAGNWQGERHDFGPYPVLRHDGADWVRIGPDIVNKIDEYTPLQISVGGQVADVNWPDDVPPRAGAAVLGGLQSTARPVLLDTGNALVGKPAEADPKPEPVPEPPEIPEDIVPPDPVQPDPVQSFWRKVLLPLLVVGFLIGAIVAAWALILRDETPTEVADPCTRSALIALDGFGAMQKAIRACGDALSPDTVLKIVEDGAQQNDPDALLLFGTLYDGAQEDGRIEKVIGLSFDHDAAKAAEYYARAVTAGSDAARTRLTASCAQLAGSDQTLAKGAYDDFCR